MFKQCFVTIAIVILFAGCASMLGNRQNALREHDLRVGNIPGKLHPEWAEADRCTKCHMVWSWEFGYYRGWDRHGFISDYEGSSPFGYKDPYGLDIPENKFADYYYTEWWNGAWLSEPRRTDRSTNLDCCKKVNDGTSKPGDFDCPVIIVDQSGAGDAKTIQAGVDKAIAGTTVFVRSGTYPEHVRMHEGIRLWGENAHTTIINPDFTVSAITAANGCDISGFTLTGTGMNYKDYTFTAGIHALDCDSTLVIHGNIFDSNAVYGVLVESSLIGGTPTENEERYIPFAEALDNQEYIGYPNPRIIGNSFYYIGERAVFSIHASPEIANNVFIGNVKTVGMTQHSTPFIHHNVFYRNNVTINMNRSMPVIANNIMLRNYWGQRVVEGACPSIYDNVTWESPYYKEFREDGSPIYYNPLPGTGELSVDPKFADADAGDFSFATDSNLASGNSGTVYGIVQYPGIQQPPKLACEKSYAEAFNNRNETSDSIVRQIKENRKRLENLRVSYTVDYKSFMKVDYDRHGDQKSITITDDPVSGTSYYASRFIIDGDKRYKQYRSRRFAGAESAADSGTVVCNGDMLKALTGRFRDSTPSDSDPWRVAEVVTRENVGGLYLDYDQYLNGAIGPMGTFYFGYITLFGAKVLDEPVLVDGHKCLVLIYPNIGTDQQYRFYLDPAIGYQPRKLEHYFERELYRSIDGYAYEIHDGINVPTQVTVTDYAVKKPHIGRVVGIGTMKVDRGSLFVNKPGTVIPYETAWK